MIEREREREAIRMAIDQLFLLVQGSSLKGNEEKE